MSKYSQKIFCYDPIMYEIYNLKKIPSKISINYKTYHGETVFHYLALSGNYEELKKELIRARSELGMIGPSESFYQVVPKVITAPPASELTDRTRTAQR